MITTYDFVPGLISPSEKSTEGYWFIFQNRNLLVSLDYQLEVSSGPFRMGLEPLRTQYLGELKGEKCFSGEVSKDSEPPEGMKFRDLRSLYKRIPNDLYHVAGRAVLINDWDRNHCFCGACGKPTKTSSNERSRVCSECNLPHFPRIAPAIITSVERDREILLARSPHFPPGILSILAGFVEPGESLEEAVKREVREETGIDVGNIKYFGSQPWPYPNSLMLGFQAEYKSGEIEIDGVEIEDADWYSVENMPTTFAGDISISQWLIQDFINRKKNL